MSEQAWNFTKKENPVFSCDLYEIFLEHLFYRRFPGATLSLLLESPIFWGFLSSNLPHVYLWVFWFALPMLLFYLLSNSNHTDSFYLSQSLYSVCCLNKFLPNFSFPNQRTDVRKNVKTPVNVLPMV